MWWCFPRLDSDPVFSRLIAGDEEKGFSDVVLDRFARAESRYERNTAIVTTLLTAEDGAQVRITDFAPRLKNFERILRPPQLMRIIEPVAGAPHIAIRVRPTQFYGSPMKRRIAGSSHVAYGEPALIRLTTDAPLSYIQQETPFVLTRPLHLIFGPDEPFTGDIAATVRDFYTRTADYWREWVRRLSIAYEWQDATIRAAITLKLSNFEETGGIVAALTTSLPEAPGSGRNWDYRYCWLRDAYFVVKALNAIGATRTMEGFIGYHPFHRRRGGCPQAGLWHRAQRRSHRRDRAGPEGLRRSWSSAHRQCRSGTGAARRLRQRDPLCRADVLRQASAVPR